MNVWLIQTGEPFPTQPGASKLRTGHLAERLMKNGHNITLWTSAFDHLKKRWISKVDDLVTVNDNFQIFALKGLGYKRNLSLRRYVDHWIVAKKFKKFSKQLALPDIIVASMPPYDIAYEASVFAKENNVPVIVDVRDEWPDIFINFIHPIFIPLLKLALWRDYAKLTYLMRNADALVSMMNPLLDWGLKYAGRERRKTDAVFYLGGTKFNFLAGSKNNIMHRYNIPQDKFIVTFIGTFVVHNNPSVLIECAKWLKNQDKIHFVFAGDGSLYQELTWKAAGCSNITFTGWLGADDIAEVLKITKVGVCTSPYNRHAFPNKVFTYLSAGIPIISSFEGELKILMRERQFGFYFQPGDYKELADCIMRLFNSTQLYGSLVENVRSIFHEMFDADKIYLQYAEYVESIGRIHKLKK